MWCVCKKEWISTYVIGQKTHSHTCSSFVMQTRGHTIALNMYIPFRHAMHRKHLQVEWKLNGFCKPNEISVQYVAERIQKLKMSLIYDKYAVLCCWYHSQSCWYYVHTHMPIPLEITCTTLTWYNIWTKSS